MQVCSSEALCLNLHSFIEFAFKFELVAMRNKLSVWNHGKLEYSRLQESCIFYVFFLNFNYELLCFHQ